MRQLEYAVEGKAANLKTFAVDEPGSGGACHHYKIVDGNYSLEPPDAFVHIHFQNGPINVDGNGVNGIQNEDLLAIVIDRLKGFQSGPYACEDNHGALRHLTHAMEFLQARTKARIARGVEGTRTM